MNLFVSHSHFGIGKIQQVNGNRVDVFFPQFPDEQLRQFTREAFGTSVSRVVLNPGTPCIVDHQRCIVDHLVCKGEAIQPHEYCLLKENGGTLEVPETQIELTNIKDSLDDDKEVGNEIRPGLFVSANDHHGIGKVHTIYDNQCEVAFFQHPGTENIRRYPLKMIERAILSPETRVFVEQEDGWLVGRVTDGMSGSRMLYTIRFPNKVERILSESDLYVRCLSARHSPLELMAHRGMETQFFHDARIAFIRSITKQRNCSQGLSGVLSSNVELVAHQIRAAQQVLSDPVQRYVLADEVGLGKTIEAGFVIRQTLLDLPSCQVGVLVPLSLVGQWEQELRNKFRVSHFLHEPIVLPFEQADQLAGLDLELLVVDEAHNIFSPQGVDATVTQLCLESRRLLLLTATPVIGHEQTFLNMLKVLDPDVFSEMDIDTFHQRVKCRQEFGALARMFTPGENSIPLLAMITARKLLATDEKAMSLLEDLKAAENKETKGMTRAALHRHIVEHHRIFHRLIRNRRKDIEDNSFLPRSFDAGTDHIIIMPADDPATEELVGFFEEWRQAAHDMLRGVDASALHGAMAIDCARLFEAVGTGIFGRELERMVMLGSPGGRVDGAANIAAAALRVQAGAPSLADALLRAVKKALEIKKRTGYRSSAPIEVVVFQSNVDLCRKLETTFSPPPGVRIHFLNQQDEEGQNFQKAEVIVHLDVPLDPVRMEQRIGRLDRFDRKARSILHLCFHPGGEKAGNPWHSWLNTLVSGFRIFNEPISDVQFLLESERIRLAEALLLQGVSGIDGYRETLANRLVEERNALDEQYEFDKRAPLAVNEVDWFEALQDLDDDWQSLARDLDWLAAKALGIRVHKNEAERSYTWGGSTLIPAIPWKNFFAPGLGLPSTFWRTKAMRHQDASLLRLGHPLIDGLERFCRWDVRGLAFATWRNIEALSLSAPWVGFKLDYIVEGDLREWENDLRVEEKLTSARRRTDSLLPPWLETHFLDSNLSPVTDMAMLEYLRHPYRSGPGQDYNLQSRLEALDSVLDSSALASLVHDAVNVGETLVRDGEVFQAATSSAFVTTRSELTHRLKRLHTYAQYHRDKSIQEKQLQLEQAFEELVARAVMKPCVRLESIGLFVLAPYKP